MDRRDIGSWLTTPGTAPEELGARQEYRGQLLGLPPEGSGAIAPVSRRVLALAVDWAASLLITSLILPGVSYGEGNYGFVTLAVFAVEVIVFTLLIGSSFGQRLLGIQVVRVDRGRPGPLPIIVRTLLLCLVIPAVVWDRDTRGLHDKAAGSVCVLR